MRFFAPAAGILVCAGLLLALDPQDLFDQARRNVLANLEKTPRYTCVETITREVRRTVHPREACAPGATNAAAGAYGELLWHDRLKLDVAVIKGTETFSWAGARQFETEDVNTLVGGGATGTGDFSGFLMSVFGTDARKFSYTGEQNTPAGLTARFEFKVPLATSHYRYRTHGEFKTAPYEGWFLIDPSTAALRHMAMVTTAFDPEDDVCRVDDAIDYQILRIGDSDFTVPRVSSMNAVYTQGTQARNTTEYSGCHEYTASSTIRFDDAPQPSGRQPSGHPVRSAGAEQPLPAGIDFDVSLVTPIEGQSASSGDEIEAQALADARHAGKVMIHRGDRFHGRIIRLEQYTGNGPHWGVGIRFYSVERDGVETPVSLRPLDDGIRSGQQLFGKSLGTSSNPRYAASLDKPPGTGLFIFFSSGKLSLDSHFHSRWVTAAKDAGEEAPSTPPK